MAKKQCHCVVTYLCFDTHCGLDLFRQQSYHKVPASSIYQNVLQELLKISMKPSEMTSRCVFVISRLHHKQASQTHIFSKTIVILKNSLHVSADKAKLLQQYTKEDRTNMKEASSLHNVVMLIKSITINMN
jgi:hypothetical protein